MITVRAQSVAEPGRVLLSKGCYMKGILRVIRLGLQAVGLAALVGLVALFILDPDGVGRAPTRIIQKAVEKKDSLFRLASFVTDEARPQVQTSVVVDQLGYRRDDPKIGIVKGNHHKKPFEAIDVVTGESVYTGSIRTEVPWDPSTGDVTSVMDFTAMRTPGRYRLEIPGTALVSGEFRIDDTVYNQVFVATTESFYYQRCGTEVDNGTMWKHPPCHMNDGAFYNTPSAVKEVTGGWHDAGDYGKYVVTGAPSAAFLLYLYEYSPERFTDGQLNIPESQNGLPDLLDEARWELAWLLKFQGEDGGVYHKVANKKWTGNYLPHLDPDTRYISSVSSAATADFAAVTALAARLFRAWDKPYAHRLLRASMDAWRFLAAHPDIVPPGGFLNPQGVEGGAYADNRDIDERLWAAVELYRLTGNPVYHQYFMANYQRAGGFSKPFGWQHVDSFAFASYLSMPKRLANRKVRNAIQSSLIQHCDGRLKLIEQNGYRYVLKPDEYYWGSNSVGLGEAFKFIQAYEATRQTGYRDAALDQLHYNLGRNTFNISFVTGVGSNPVRSPYHQFSMKLGADAPVPGLAPGGPNRHGGINGETLSQFPGQCYIDTYKNYKVNEVAINYTAPLVYVAGYFSHFDSRVVEK